MATIQVPKINKIYKMTEFDVLRTSVKMGNMYICLDSLNMYYDRGTGVNDRQLYSYTGVRTRKELLYEITPDRGITYYCWEDNSLWYWNNKWVALYSETTYPSAYVYDDIPSSQNPSNINSIYRYDMPNMPADDNGLLRDGSVVVRDMNRIIKGKISVSDENDNMVISSFLGGGLRLLPNGKDETDGEFLIEDVIRYIDGTNRTFPLATLRAELSILNNEMFVNYAEHPEDDMSEFPNNEHIYKVYHEGNLDVSAIKIMTPLQIYNKLLDDSLPAVFDFNVTKLQGHDADYFARRIHTHAAEDITDLYSTVVTQAGIATKAIFNNMDARGLTGHFDTLRNVLVLDVNDFTLTFGGGVTGSATITDLSNTNIDLAVDGSRHTHANYETTMQSLQNQIDAIDIDVSSTYTRAVIDSKVDEVRGTALPTSGKPLLVNSQGILPGISSQAKQLDHYIDITVTGAVVGSIRTNGSDSTLTINTELGDSALISSMISTKINERNIAVPIGDGVSTSFTVRHNLNTENILIQFRDNTTKKEVHLDNTTLDANRVRIDSNMPIANGGVTVLIYKIS